MFGVQREPNPQAGFPPSGIASAEARLLPVQSVTCIVVALCLAQTCLEVHWSLDDQALQTLIRPATALLAARQQALPMGTDGSMHEAAKSWPADQKQLTREYPARGCISFSHQADFHSCTHAHAEQHHIPSGGF